MATGAHTASHFDLEKVQGFIDLSRRASGHEELARAFRSLIGRFGFEEFIAAALIDPDERPSEALYLNHYTDAWWLHYREMGYLEVDPLYYGARTEQLPFVWSEYRKGKKLSKQQRNLFAEARLLGHNEGITVPIHITGETSCCVSVTGPVDDVDPAARHTIHLASIYFAEAGKRINRRNLYFGDTEEKGDPPTTREADVLQWLAAGKKAWEIGVILGITERTVRFHLANVQRKYGATTPTQAVALAIVHQHIQP